MKEDGQFCTSATSQRPLSEDMFVWCGTANSAFNSSQFIWLPGEPNKCRIEKCGSFQLNNLVVNENGLNDAPCSERLHILCKNQNP